MKPLDLVRTPGGGLAVIREVVEVSGRKRAALEYLKGCKPTGQFHAWWDEGDLDVFDSIPRLLTQAISGPAGKNEDPGDVFFPVGG